jgi:hypothetical protein
MYKYSNDRNSRTLSEPAVTSISESQICRDTTLVIVVASPNIYSDQLVNFSIGSVKEINLQEQEAKGYHAINTFVLCADARSYILLIASLTRINQYLTE